MLALQRHNLSKVVQPQDSRFPSVPGKIDHSSGRSIDMLDNVCSRISSDIRKEVTLSIEVFLLQIITVTAVEITDRAAGLGKNLKFAGRFSH